MIIERRRLFFFKTAFVVLDERADSIDPRPYSQLTIVSHSPLSIPHARLREKTTGIIDLKGSPEELLQTFSKTTRNEISRSIREGQIVRHSPHVTKEGYALYRRFEKSIGRRPFARAATRGCEEILIYDGKRPIAGVFYYPSRPITRIRSIFSARKEKNLSSTTVSWAARRSIYEVCCSEQSARSEGVDLASINLTDKAKKGISDFKLSFSPRITQEYMYVHSSPVYAFFERIRRLLRS
ncbi:MAG TPA: hypothetical protein VMU25_03630 [Candidatus Paceibacterota bacterium]|nr:hypothetical protein [Candidatus Paceibacterota bacterium]